MARDPADELNNGLGQFDSPASATLRFLVELIAWVAGPWAVATITGELWTAIPAALILIGAVSIFSTPGDKLHVVVATPGPVRLVIEILLATAAVVGAWIAWPTWLAIVVTVIVGAALITGIPRARWLARGAPLT